MVRHISLSFLAALLFPLVAAAQTDAGNCADGTTSLLTPAAPAISGKPPPAISQAAGITRRAGCGGAPAQPAGAALQDPTRDALYGLPSPELTKVLPTGPTD